ncbi:hypothetical protein SBA1_1340023 [Candidatus Sulfotelmatobacter kueseliae]|uniref:Uncharacterized protein n=1 Tax=Candidatus Sulfotelmatobacter kueseliae TaxID=2042962 RepID=A0A2U3K5I5_9BACT|nr:hypothetical protein SBA1_1340023 [Candidatus Sulfotelmatobacter kueseliae]
MVSDDHNLTRAVSCAPMPNEMVAKGKETIKQVSQAPKAQVFSLTMPKRRGR